MTTGATQTVWAELIAGTLADAGVATCVISPGSRSTPLVAALARVMPGALVTIIDERAAAFYALGAARATGAPAVVVCTSGTAAAHYLPAIVEASLAGVPLLALTADRPPELQACGASQTIDQVGLYGGYVRAALDLGAPTASELALRAVRRKLIQALALARGPRPGPVHINAPLRKPLEPAAPTTDEERALAACAAALRAPLAPDPLAPQAIAPPRLAPDPLAPQAIAPPRLAPDPLALERLAAAIAREPDGVIVAGALPAPGAGALREAVFALAARAGYPIIAEASSQLRCGPRPDGVVFVDRFDLIPPARLPRPRLVVELGAEPVAAAWPAWIAQARPERWILAGHAWRDPDGAAHTVVLGEPLDAVRAVAERLARRSHGASLDRWVELEIAATAAAAAAIAAHPRSEVAALEAAVDAMPSGAALQLGNSLPIRTIDHVPAPAAPHPVLSQRGAAGIDGLIASAAGATRAGAPVLLVLGDVSFAHDVGGLLAARDAVAAPLAILVLDNGGGQIFAGLPVSRAHLGAAFDAHWLTAPRIEPAAVAAALGLRATTAPTPLAVAGAVAAALAPAAAPAPGTTVIHAPVTASGARDVRRAALEPGGSRP